MYSQLFRSRTVWTIAALFIINGFAGISGMLPVESLPYINGILSIMAIYFKLNPSQQYGKQ